MNKQPNRYISKFTIGLLLLASSCQDHQSIQTQENTAHAVIINSPTKAIQGKILLKLKPHTQVFSKANTAPVEAKILDENFLEAIQPVVDLQLSRVFPVDKRKEALTRQEGLHLWYTLTFDPATDLVALAQRLSKVASIDRIQYVTAIEVEQDPTPFLSIDKKALSRTALTKSDSPFNDPDFNLQWHLHNTGTLMEDKFSVGADVNALEAWKRCTGDSTIIVAVLDNGVQYDHPDLIANMWVNPGEEIGAGIDGDGNGYVDDKHGYRFCGRGGAIGNYGTGHGTHVAGLVSAVNNNGVGISSVAGGSGNNDGVRIMSCQIFEGTTGVATLEQEARAIKYAADNGAVILQCSWGSKTSAYNSDEAWMNHLSIEKEALDYFIHNAGSPNGVIDGGIVVFAAGNESMDQLCYPARYKDYVSVSSIAADFTPSLFTNFEDKTSVCAPGGDITYHSYNPLGGIYSTLPTTEGYAANNGTSMATPIVSSVAALGLSYANQLKKHFKAEEFMELLVQATRTNEANYTGTKDYFIISSEDGSHHERRKDISGYKGKMGSGIIDANKMLDAIDQNGSQMRIPNISLKKGAKTTLHLDQYFVNGDALLFEATIKNSEIGKIEVDKNKLIIHALKDGITSIQIKAQNINQEISLIVSDNVSDGWL